MPTSTRETLLARYHYDPLDRLVDSPPFEQSAIQRYYCKTRLATETQGGVQCSIVQHDNQLLAQQQRENGKVSATLLVTDQQRSVLNVLDANQSHPLAYSPYGHRPIENGLLSLLGFNGERPDPVTGNYHLGNGYRQFNPVLMRFNSPDSWSPFGEGGVNAYAYCGGDPINRADPNGHSFMGLILVLGGGGSIAGGSVLLSKEDPSVLSFVAGLALVGFGTFLTVGGGVDMMISSSSSARSRNSMPTRDSISTYNSTPRNFSSSNNVSLTVPSSTQPRYNPAKISTGQQRPQLHRRALHTDFFAPPKNHIVSFNDSLSYSENYGSVFQRTFAPSYPSTNAETIRFGN
ncbi:RHS repeat-associated core domain-containing protein [Pseudomonas sp. Irchel s3a18]|uniref:RHS repeat-associated core domain-containing protein n=1 Tax=Pseudomonas sp. Irchel s3a18 TaxID=2009053 RepID=UPI000BA486AB|nr:RHS repeat-associated core domain-containing protein [Pseudomonas sp. Irchel s3a18]